MRNAVGRQTPFFVYFNHSLMHMPVVPRPEFKGRTGQGDWADSLLELDPDFGMLLDLLDELGIADNTLVVFAGDNGPEEVVLWRGTPGYWEGSYFAGGEGNLRTPCIVSQHTMQPAYGRPRTTAPPGHARPAGRDRATHRSSLVAARWPCTHRHERRRPAGRAPLRPRQTTGAPR
jgi:hypothetical protein